MVQNTWQYQGRQQHGEFGHGTAPHTDPPAKANLATRTAYVAHAVIGHLAPTAARFYELRLAGGLLDRLRKVVADHPAAAHLDDEAYARQILGNRLTPEETRLLRQTAARIHGARILNDLAPATATLGRLVASAGLPRLSQALAAASTATIPPPPVNRPPVIKAQEIVLPWMRPFLFGRGPFLVEPKVAEPKVYPEVPDDFLRPPPDPRFPGGRGFKERVPKQSGKEGAKDSPSWARPHPPWEGESPDDYVERLMRWKYGNDKEKWRKPEVSKLKKWATRHFRERSPNVRSIQPGEMSDDNVI